MMTTESVRRWKAVALLLLSLKSFNLLPGAQIAHAAWAHRVVVPPLQVAEGGTERLANRLWAGLNEELKSRTGQVEWVALPQARPAPRPVVGPPSEVQPMLSAGRAALAELRFSEASKKLKKALDWLLADPARTDFEWAKEAYLLLSVASFRMGEERLSELAMGSLFRIEPDFELGTNYPPVFIREFEKSRARQKRLSTQELQVEGPEGATAFLNGKPLGPVPAVARQLAPGTHYVKVEGEYGETFARAVDVRAGEDRVRASFASPGVRPRPLSAPTLAQGLTSETLALAAQYTKAAGADHALMGVLYRQDERLMLAPILYGARRQAFFALTAREFPGDGANVQAQLSNLCEEVLELLQGTPPPVELPYALTPFSRPVVARPEPVVAPPAPRRVLIPGESLPAPSPSPILAKATTRPSPPFEVEPAVLPPRPSPVSPWVWVAVGVGLAAVGVGAYYGYTLAQQPVRGTVTAQW